MLMIDRRHYVLRTDDIVLQLAELQKKHPNREIRDEVPGDYVVDADLRTTYVIGPDGSRRRIRDGKLTEYLKQLVRDELTERRIAAEKAADAERFRAELERKHLRLYTAREEPQNVSEALIVAEYAMI